MTAPDIAVAYRCVCEGLRAKDMPKNGLEIAQTGQNGPKMGQSHVTTILTYFDSIFTPLLPHFQNGSKWVTPFGPILSRYGYILLLVFAGFTIFSTTGAAPCDSSRRRCLVTWFWTQR